MFFDPDLRNHGLRYNPIKACVVPRPIGWITTRKPNGRVNLAPYSQFNIVGYEPGFVMFSANTHPPDFLPKHSTFNAEHTGEFVYNMATYELRDAVHRSSTIIDTEGDDLEALALTPAPCKVVDVPRVAQSPVAFECRHYTTLTLPGSTPDTTHRLVVGRIVGIHIDDEAITDGKLDLVRVKPLARLGYADYTTVESIFHVNGEDGGLPRAVLRKMFGGT